MKYFLTVVLAFSSLSAYSGVGDGSGQPDQNDAESDQSGILNCVAYTVSKYRESLSLEEIAQIVAKCLSEESSTEGVGDGSGNQGS